MRSVILASACALALAGCNNAADETTPTLDTEVAGDAIVVGEATASDTVLDANTVTMEQLAGVEGVSPELAAAIIADQPYADVTAFRTKLLETANADEADAILTRVFVPVNLNSASEEEIRLIPGMSDEMVHEFEEYRPYADMAEFNREIGKYVDEAEVARLRGYVTL